MEQPSNEFIEFLYSVGFKKITRLTSPAYIYNEISIKEIYSLNRPCKKQFEIHIINQQINYGYFQIKKSLSNGELLYKGEINHTTERKIKELILNEPEFIKYLRDDKLSNLI